MATNNSNKMYFINAASLTNTSSAGTTASGVFAVYDKSSDSLRIYDNNDYVASKNNGMGGSQWDYQAFADLRAELDLPKISNNQGNQYGYWYWDPHNYAQPFNWSGSSVLPMAALFPKAGDTVSFFGTKDELFSIGQTGFNALGNLKFSGGTKVDKIILTDQSGTDSANLSRIFVTADQARLLASGGIKIDQLNTVIQDTPAAIDSLVKDISAPGSTLGAKLAAAGVSNLYVDPATFVAGSTGTYSVANITALANSGIKTTLEVNNALDLKTLVQKDPGLSLYTTGLKVDLGNGLVDPTAGVLMDPVEGTNSTSELTSWMSTFSGAKLNIDAGVFLKLYSSHAYHDAGPEINQMHLKAGTDVTISASVETLLSLSNPNPAFDNMSLKDATQAMVGVADKLVIYTNGGDSLLGHNQNEDGTSTPTEHVRSDLLNNNQVFDPQSGQIVTGTGALNKIEQALGDTPASQFIEIKSTTGATTIPVDAALELANAGFKFSAGDTVTASVQSVDLAKADSLAVYSYSVDRYDSLQLYSDDHGHTFAGRSDVQLDGSNHLPYINSWNSVTNQYDKVYISGDIAWSTTFNNIGAPDGSWNDSNMDHYAAEYNSNWQSIAKDGFTLSTATISNTTPYTDTPNSDTNGDGWTSGGESSMLFAQQQSVWNGNTYSYDTSTNATTTSSNVSTDYTYSYYDWHWDDSTYSWVQNDTPTTYTYAYQTQATVAQNLSSVTDYGQGRIWKFNTSNPEAANYAAVYLDKNNDGINNDGDGGSAAPTESLGAVRLMGATYDTHTVNNVDVGTLHFQIATDQVDGSGNTAYYRADITITDTADTNGNGIADGAEKYLDQNTYSYVYQGKDGKVDSASDYSLLQTAQQQGYYFDFNNNGINDAQEGLSYSASSPIYDINGDGIKDVPDANNDGQIDSSLFSSITLDDLHALANAGLDAIKVTGQQLMFPLSDTEISSDPTSDSYKNAIAKASDLIDAVAHSSLKFLTQDGNPATLVFSDVRAQLDVLSNSDGFVTGIEPIAINVDEAVRLAAHGIKMAGADGNGILRIVDTADNLKNLVSDGSLVTAQALRDIGVVDIDASDSKRIDLKLDQAKAMGLAGLHFNGDSNGADYVVVSDDVSKISQITAAQIIALGSLGVDKINATSGTADASTITVDVNKMRAMVESNIVVDASDNLQMNIAGNYLTNQGATNLASIADSIARVGLDQINPLTTAGAAGAQLELTADGFNAFKDYIIGTSTTGGIFSVAPTKAGLSLSGIKVTTSNDADLTLIGSAAERKAFTDAGMTITQQKASDVNVHLDLKITEGQIGSSASSVLSLSNFFNFNSTSNKVALTDVLSTGVTDVTIDVPNNSGLTIMHQSADGWQRADRTADGKGGYNVTLDLSELAAGNYAIEHDSSFTQGEFAFNGLSVRTGTHQTEFLRVSDSTSQTTGYTWYAEGKSYSLYITDDNGIKQKVATHTFSSDDGAYDNNSAAQVLQHDFAQQLQTSGDLTIANLSDNALKVESDHDRLKFTWAGFGLQEDIKDGANGTVDLTKFTSRLSLSQDVPQNAGIDGEDLTISKATQAKIGSKKGTIDLVQADNTTLRSGDKFTISMTGKALTSSTSSNGTPAADPTTKIWTFELKATDFFDSKGVAITGYKVVANAINTFMKTASIDPNVIAVKNMLGYTGTESATVLGAVATVNQDAAKNDVSVSIGLAQTKVVGSLAGGFTAVTIAQNAEAGSSDVELATIKGLGGVYDQQMTGTTIDHGATETVSDFITYTAVDKAPTVAVSDTSSLLHGVQGAPAIFLDGMTLDDSDGVNSMDELTITLSALRGAYDGKFKTVELDSWLHVKTDKATTVDTANRYSLDASSLTLNVKKSELVYTQADGTHNVGDAKVDINHDGVIDAADTTFFKDHGLVGAINQAIDNVSFVLGKVIRSEADSSVSFDMTTSNLTNAVIQNGVTVTAAANPTANSLVTVSFDHLVDTNKDGMLTATDYTVSGLNTFDSFVNAVTDDNQKIVLKLAGNVTLDDGTMADLLTSGKTVDSGKFKLAAEVSTNAWTHAGESVLSLVNAGVDKVNFDAGSAAQISLADLNATKNLADVQLLGNMSVTGGSTDKDTFVLPWSINLASDSQDGLNDGSVKIQGVLDQTVLQITDFNVAKDVLSLAKFSGKALDGAHLIVGTNNAVDTSGYDFTATAGSDPVTFDATAALGVSSTGIYAVAVSNHDYGGTSDNDVAITFISVTQDLTGAYVGQQAGTVELLGVSNVASVTSSLFAAA